MTRSVAAPGKTGSNRARIGPWILDPWNDLAWFILAPAWILALAWALKDWAVLGALGGVLLAIGATGHHLPGFIRAYTDPVLFRRFKGRFLAAPVFFLGVCAFFAGMNLRGLEVILLLWGAWHGAMQVNGFLRIYDSKAGSISPSTAWLDWALCVVWFGGALLYSEPKLHLLGLTLQRTALPLPTLEGIQLVRQGWMAIAALVTAAFLVNAAVQFRKGVFPNPVKFLAMGVAFAFWWFCMVHVLIPILGLLLFEIFHDVQYNVLVWAYQRNRVVGGKAAGWVERFLFKPSPLRLALYLALILAYGGIGVLANYAGLHVPGGLEASGAAGISGYLAYLFIASAFLHFYFDGFIWRVREPEIREGMGMAPASRSMPKERPSGTAWLPGGLKWAFFVVPVSFLAISEIRGMGTPPIEAYRSLAQILPRTGEVHLALGSMEMEAGNPAAAAASLEKASELMPDLDIQSKVLAELFSKAGNPERAIHHYRKASVERPEDMTLRYDLGLLLRNQGRIEEALPELRTVADRHPENAGTNYSAGLALLLVKRVPEAIPYLERCVAADPGHKLGWNYLGVAKEAVGRVAEALACYRRALAADSGFQEARNNLIQAESRLRDAGNGGKTGSPKAPGSAGSGTFENLGNEGAGSRKIVFEMGKTGGHPDGIAFADFAGAEVHPSRIGRAIPLSEADAVHGNAGGARKAPFPQGGQHTGLDILPGGAAEQGQEAEGRKLRSEIPVLAGESRHSDKISFREPVRAVGS